MTKKVVVKQMPDAETVPVEILATAIVAMSEGIKKLRAGRLTDKALILLIQHACPTFGKYPAKIIGTSHIKAVLSGIESMASEYVKKPK